MNHNDAITVTDLVKTYAGQNVVDGVSFSVTKGEVFGLLGPNGAGKSTTIESIVGLRQPTSGSITVLGMTPRDDRRGFTERVSIQPQSASLFESLTVDETLRLFRSFYAQGRDPETVREDVGLDEQRKTRVKNLSGGQLRRLLLAVALIGDPEVVILDEPSAGLDPAARQGLWGIIRGLSSSGTTVLLSTHHMDEATELCDRVGILVAGRLVALDSPENLILARDAETTVSFTVDAGADLAGVHELVDADAVLVGAGKRGDRVRIRTAEPDDLIRKLTFVRGLRAREFDIKRGTLEDLFLELSDADAHAR